MCLAMFFPTCHESQPMIGKPGLFHMQQCTSIFGVASVELSWGGQHHNVSLAMALSYMQQVHHLCLVWQVEVPEWYVPGEVRATSPETPRLSAAVQASAAATQEVLAVFDITHGKQAFASVVQHRCLCIQLACWF